MGFKSIVLVASALVLSTSVNAAVVYTQAVDAGIYGLDSELGGLSNQRVADNFLLSNDTNINSVGWFGGYFGSSNETLAHDFRIRFYEDNAGTPMMASFFEQTINVVGTSTAQANGSGTIFEYNANISTTLLLGGQQYWIEIIEADLSTSDRWRIAEATPDATGITRRFNDVGSWDFGLAANSRGELAVNLSGELAAVPVPAAVWLFGSGLIGLVGVARRKSV